MSESKELLGAYLNDHLAGSSAGAELAETILQDSEGTPLGSMMATLLAEIQADRTTLVDLMDRLGIARSTMKRDRGQAAALAGPQVHRGHRARAGGHGPGRPHRPGPPAAPGPGTLPGGHGRDRLRA
ncbi:MAG: hypothetical protein LC733_01855 [Actinobacteria bacterium]|nr:hypothetical protein [Actinomycetota bacterium]